MDEEIEKMEERGGKEQVYRDKKERGLSVCAVFLSSVPERE